jgi:hypothetical protein
MNHSTKKVYFLSVLIGLTLAVLASVFRTVMLLKGYEPNLGQFADTPVSKLFMPLLFVLSIVVAIGFGIFFRSLLSNRSSNQTLPGIFASALAAMTSLVWLVVLAIEKMKSGLPMGPARILFLLMALFAFSAIAHFIYSALGGSDARLRLFLGAGVAVFCAFYMLFAYFDPAFTLNSPIKIFDQITFFLVALFFLADCRFHVDKISDAAFLPIGMICMVFTAANAAPGLIYAAVSKTALVGNVMHDFLSLALFLYIVARMLSFPLSVSEQGKQDVFAVEMASTSDDPYEIDNETHITEEDPRQETFHFDEEENANTAQNETEKEDEVPTDEENGSSAQTTLDINHKSDE